MHRYSEVLRLSEQNRFNRIPDPDNRPGIMNFCYRLIALSRKTNFIILYRPNHRDTSIKKDREKHPFQAGCGVPLRITRLLAYYYIEIKLKKKKKTNSVRLQSKGYNITICIKCDTPVLFRI